MKKIIQLVLLLCICKPVAAQTIHVIIAIDQVDMEFGLVSLGDQDYIERMFQVVEKSKIVPNPINFIFLSQEDFTADKFRSTINNLKTTSKDLIFFYYSGKGIYSNQNSAEFPGLAVNGYQKSPISQLEIVALLDKKPKQFSMVMADCRNFYNKQPPPVMAPPPVEPAPDPNAPPPPPPPSPPPPPPIDPTEDFQKLILKKLFLEACGSISIASSSKEGRVFTDNEGMASLFTHTFYEQFIKLLDTPLNEIDNLNFLKLLSNTRENVVFFSFNEQIPRIKNTPCPSNLNNQVKKMASLKMAPTYPIIKEQFKMLEKTKTLPERKAAIEKLRPTFHKNALVTVHTFKGQMAKEISQKTVKVNVFLKDLEKYNPNVEFIESNAHLTTRSPDYLSYAAMRVNIYLK